MSDDTEQHAAVVSNRTMEIAVAVVIMAFSALVMVSNYELGASWSSDGPEAGYFPFYVGVILFLSALSIFVGQLVGRGRLSDGGTFVTRGPFLRVLQVLFPTIGYVVLISYIGIYVSTALFITFFMVWLGRYRIPLAIAMGVGVAVILFFTFEIWFLVALPKGPLEAWLGY